MYKCDRPKRYQPDARSNSQPFRPTDSPTRPGLSSVPLVTACGTRPHRQHRNRVASTCPPRPPLFHQKSGQNAFPNNWQKKLRINLLNWLIELAEFLPDSFGGSSNDRNPRQYSTVGWMLQCICLKCTRPHACMTFQFIDRTIPRYKYYYWRWYSIDTKGRHYCMPCPH